MEYLIRGISGEENKAIFTRLTEIPKSRNGLVNVINESERERIVDISDIISYCFANSTDHKLKGHIIKDIIIAQDNETIAFKVIYNDFFYYKDYGEISYEIGEDIYYVQGDDANTTRIKKLLLNHVKEFKEKEQEINEQNAQNRIAEAERLKKVKKEVIAVLKAVLKDKEYINPSIPYNQFKSFVDSNKNYVDDYIRRRWKYTSSTETVTCLTSIVSMLVGVGFVYYEDLPKALASFCFCLVPPIIKNRIEKEVNKNTLAKAEESFRNAGSEEITGLERETEELTKAL